jgi:hypothetical protein
MIELLITEICFVAVFVCGWKLGRHFEADVRTDPDCPFKPYGGRY